MEKTILAISAFAMLFFAGCSKENEKQETTSGKEVTLTASVNETKVSETNGIYGWQSGDAISILTTGGLNVQFTTTSTGNKGIFSGTIGSGDAISSYAFYPYISGATISGNNITATIPSSYTYVTGKTNMFMVGSVSGSNVLFTPAGGVIKFNLADIPSSAKTFKFSTDNDVNICGNSSIDASSKVISGGDVKEITIDFSASYSSNMTFYIPVIPTTVNGFTISLLDAAGNPIYSVHSSKLLTTEANKIIIAPSVTIPDVTATTSLSTAMAASAGKSINAYNEYVVAIGANGFVISDNPATGTNVYVNATPTGLAIGDKVNVFGTLSSYNNLPEISSSSFVETSGGNVITYPTATDITSTFDSYTTATASNYVQLTGLLTVSGSSYTISVAGATTYTGNLFYPGASLNASKYAGQTITVKGYYLGISGTSPKYHNILPVSITADPFLNLPETSKSIGAAAGSLTFNVNSNTTWTASAASGNTMNITGISYDNAAGTVTVTYAANASSYNKTGTINVTATSGITKTVNYVITQTGSGTSTTVTKTTFSTVSGTLDTKITYVAKNSTSTDATIYQNTIRITELPAGQTNSGYFTITAASGYKLLSVTIGSASSSSSAGIKYQIDGGTASSTETLAAGGRKTVSGMTSNTVKFSFNSTTMATAFVNIDYISATYSPE